MGSTKKNYCNEKVYQEIADELEIPVSLVRDVILNGQSKFTAKTMSNDSFQCIKWPYLGSFKIKAKTVQLVKHIKSLPLGPRKVFISTLPEKLKNEYYKTTRPYLHYSEKGLQKSDLPRTPEQQIYDLRMNNNHDNDIDFTKHKNK